MRVCLESKGMGIFSNLQRCLRSGYMWHPISRGICSHHSVITIHLTLFPSTHLGPPTLSRSLTQLSLSILFLLSSNSLFSSSLKLNAFFNHPNALLFFLIFFPCSSTPTVTSLITLIPIALGPRVEVPPPYAEAYSPRTSEPRTLVPIPRPDGV